MLTFFPALQKDELLYSGIARFGALLRIPAQTYLSRMAFGLNRGRVAPELPNMIGRFVARLPTGGPYTADVLIDNHTLLPYYQPFMVPGSAAVARRAMEATDVPQIERHVGVTSKKIIRGRPLLFCPACAKEDIKRIGMPTWRRVHQCPGVYVCPVHQRTLHSLAKFSPSTDYRRAYSALLPQAITRGHPITVPPEAPQSLLLNIARQSQWLLDHGVNIDASQSGHLQSRLWLLMRQEGWLRFTNKLALSTSRFGDSLRQYVGESTLPFFECPFDARNMRWVLRLLYRPDRNHPVIRYLLVLNFLDVSVEDFLKMEAPPLEEIAAICPIPRTGGPLRIIAPDAALCGNRFCPQFKADPRANPPPASASPDVPRACRATVVCRACGFAYTLDPSRARWRIRQTGKIWDQAVAKLLLDRSLDDYKISQACGIAVDTLRSHADRLGIWRDKRDAETLPRLPSSRSRAMQRRLDRIEKRNKQQWLDARKRYPESTRTDLRRLAPTPYAYLRKHHRDWLERHAPPVAVRRRSNKIDWDARDALLVSKFQSAVEAMLSSDAKPKRISRFAVRQAIGFKSPLYSKADVARMPRASAFLAQVKECPLGFARRRLRWLVRQCENEGIPSTFYQFQNRVGSRLAFEEPFVTEVREAYAKLRC